MKKLILLFLLGISLLSSCTPEVIEPEVHTVEIITLNGQHLLVDYDFDPAVNYNGELTKSVSVSGTAKLKIGIYELTKIEASFGKAYDVKTANFNTKELKFYLK